MSDINDPQALDARAPDALALERHVYGPLRSYSEHLTERMISGLMGAVHTLLFRTGVLNRVPRWRTVAAPRARLPLPRRTGDHADHAGWRVASGVAFQAAGAPPPPGCDEGASAGPSLWVTDPRTGLRVAYAVEDEPEAVAALRPGAAAAGLSSGLQAALAAVGALHPGEPGISDPRAERDRLAQELEADGFVVVRDLVSPGLLEALQAHFRALPTQVRLEADSFSGRLVEKNEAVARHLLHGWTDFVGQLARREVKPSYCYSMWYSPGARLHLHRDNALCEYTLNLVIDQQPAVPSHWPLCMVSRRGRIEEVYMRPGDAVLFRGRELAHFRRRLRDQGNAVGVLCHYVHADFPEDLKVAGAYD